MATASRMLPSWPAIELLPRVLKTPPHSRPRPCIFCQCQCQSTRFLSTTTRRSAKATPTSDPLNPPTDPRTPEYRHQRYKDGELIPKPLSRPLGLPHPPLPSQNTGRDTRTFTQKRDDFASYEKHLERRKGLVEDVFQKNYYRDIGNLGKIHKGKSILAPATPFKSALALYFPNLEGATLEGGGVWGLRVRDTTPVLKGKVSVVSMVNTEWANAQVQSFISAKENPELHSLIATYKPAAGLAQFATVNVEENWLKAWAIKLFGWRRMKRLVPQNEHGAYFLNRRGMTDEIRDALGMWNSKVGYVYLLDGMCRVRWAGNGYSREDERKSLVTCVRRLVDEARGVQRMRIDRQDARPTRELGQATEKKAAVAS